MSKQQRKLASLASSSPCPKEKEGAAPDRSDLASFDAWYVDRVDAVLDLVSLDLPQIVILASLMVDKEEEGMLDTSAINRGEKVRKSDERSELSDSSHS